MLTPQKFLASLKKFPAQPEIKTWWLAYSGGVDSRVLLHLLSQLDLDVRAIYVDHGLQQDSADWAQQCEYICKRHGVPFISVAVDARAASRESPEAAARVARYKALAEYIKAGHCLLTAQHQDDQAETLLLQLFRGAGPSGLAAMPFSSKFSDGWHCRPLLNFTRKQIMDYAQHHELTWVDDPSNQDEKYDRNFLRLQVMPLLQQRWPSINKTLSVAAIQQAENKKILHELAVADIGLVDHDTDSLLITDLQQLPAPRIRNLLRYWVKKQQLPVPTRKAMQQIMQQMFIEKDDAKSRVSWGGADMYRFKNRLYAVPAIAHDDQQIRVWNSAEPLFIASLNKTLSFEKIMGKGLKENVVGQLLTVSFRQGGEVIKPAGRNETHSLKKLFQDIALAPWLRSQVPLIYLNDKLIAVAGYWIDEEYAVHADETGYWPCLIVDKKSVNSW